MSYCLYKISLSLTIVSLLGFITSRPAAAVSLTYTITDLGTLGGTNAFANGINNSGQIVGGSQLPGDRTSHPFRTAPNSKINPATDDLGTFGGSPNSASGINDFGQVVGYSTSTDEITGHAFRTAPNSPIIPAIDDLGTLGGTLSFGNGINNLGQVVGASYLTGNQHPTSFFPISHAFRTDANSKIDPVTNDLGTLGGSSSYASGINDLGQVVGESDLTGDRTSHAFRTDANSKIDPVTDDLGTLGGPRSYANGINDLGQVVGYSTLSGDTLTEHAFRTAPNSKIDPAIDDLGTLGGPHSIANGINNLGQVVGESSFLPSPTSVITTHAFLYSDGTLYDLNSLVAPNSLGDFSYLRTASAINDSGQIVGDGTLPNGATHAFLATPTQAVPEPSNALSPFTFGILATGMRLKRLLKKQKSATLGY